MLRSAELAEVSMLLGLSELRYRMKSTVTC